MNFLYKNKTYKFERYPCTSNRSLVPWNAADEHILKYIEEKNLPLKKPVIFNDRFGFLTNTLSEFAPTSIIDYKSQQKAILQNLSKNQIDEASLDFIHPIDEFKQSVQYAIIKIPKSLDLFRLHLQQLSSALGNGAIVVCGFMTRHFTKQMLEIAEDYFESVEQSLAWKKSRLLILTKNKPFKELELNNFPDTAMCYLTTPGRITTLINFKNLNIKQYFGVFSAGHIDYATQFLIENIDITEDDKTILDLASGNGIIAAYLQQKNPNSEFHLIDDFYLAIESSKLNIKGNKVFFHNEDTLNHFTENYFDLVVCNPPFHFEYETNIEVSLNLFKDVKRCLKTVGRIIIVANKHLNYYAHLIKIFTSTNVVAQNTKYIIYQCTK